jgi:hypothetical protein
MENKGGIGKGFGFFRLPAKTSKKLLSPCIVPFIIKIKMKYGINLLVKGSSVRENSLKQSRQFMDV